MKKELSPIEKQLKIIGLSENEIVMYIALLELGKGTVSQISRKASLNRTTGYDVLNRLSSKKLISISGKEPKQEYVAESPDQIEILIRGELERRQSELIEARQIIPELKSMRTIGDRPKVMFYEGKEGLQKVYEDTLTSHEEILAYASVEDIQPTLPHYFPEYYKRRAKKGITIRAIFPESPEARERAILDKEEIRESLLVPNKKFGFHPEINIYDDKVMIASWREKLGIIIKSTEIADAMKKIYELSWAEAKRLDKELSAKNTG